jgi:cytochrome c oxidase cbb3-type subunit 3
MTDAAVQAGEQIYAENCSVCHGVELEGGIGPSFLDDAWIHGSDPETVVRIITDGVPDKGMLAWGPILGPEKINHVTAYVLSQHQEAVGE